jgi:hypothetical protein
METVYDLRVKCGNTFKTRRMSIRQLGDQVESKSACYKVIYDDQLVIKIPPKPIQNFKAYLDHMNKERHISLQLAPNIQCVCPSLSAILNKIPGLIDDTGLSPEALEGKYIRLLLSTPRLQNHLKIGESFVFFMNLSQSAFFNHVIEQIHEEKTRVQKEIIKNAWLFDHLDTFETIYGEDQQDVFFNVKRFYKNFETAIDELLHRFNIVDLLPEYKKKEWFFSVLAHDNPDMEEKGFPKEFLDSARKKIMHLTAVQKNVVSTYQKTVKNFVRKKIFDNNKKNIEGLSVNLLNLLCQLKNKSIAVRDLKPDNIYISTKKQDGHYQYWDCESYSLGLIDLETAADFKPSDAATFDQPLLAGTPSYMTPAHIFKNSILISIFGQGIRRIYYMQDWFAVLAMIYNAATGKILFAKTAKLIPQILQMKKKALFFHKPLSKVFKRVSIGFWKHAEKELLKKLDHEKEKFSMIHFTLPRPAVQMFQEELVHEKSILLATIDQYIMSNTLWDDIRSELISMSVYELAQYRILWEKGAVGSEMTDEARAGLKDSLKKLEKLKRYLESHQQIHPMLAQSISCHDLMMYLFNRAMLAMYRPTW